MFAAIFGEDLMQGDFCVFSHRNLCDSYFDRLQAVELFIN